MLEAAKKPKDEDALHSLVIDGLATIEELREVRKAYRAASEKIGGKDLDKVGFKSLVKGLAKLRSVTKQKMQFLAMHNSGNVLFACFAP
jgi:secreted protein with Ig-like and vWFA domain